jgi:hypothetical protein
MGAFNLLRYVLRLGLFELDYVRDGGGEATPILRFLFELAVPEACQGIEFGAAIVVGGLPLGFNPAFIFEFVERGIKRAVADL